MKCSTIHKKIKAISILQMKLHKGEIRLIKKCVHITDKQFRLENGGYISTFLNFKCTHVIKLSIELNDDISGVKDSVGEVLVTITPEMCHQVILTMRRRLQPCLQSGGQYFENLCKVAILRFRQGGTPTRKCVALSAKTEPFLKKQAGVRPA